MGVRGGRREQAVVRRVSEEAAGQTLAFQEHLAGWRDPERSIGVIRFQRQGREVQCMTCVQLDGGMSARFFQMLRNRVDFDRQRAGALLLVHAATKSEMKETRRMLSQLNVCSTNSVQYRFVFTAMCYLAADRCKDCHGSAARAQHCGTKLRVNRSMNSFAA